VPVCSRLHKPRAPQSVGWIQAGFRNAAGTRYYKDIHFYRKFIIRFAYIVVSL
jgi:hypothetical protein